MAVTMSNKLSEVITCKFQIFDLKGKVQQTQYIANIDIAHKAQRVM